MRDEITPNRRVLVIDDNEAIHHDFRKILGGGDSRGQLASMEAAIFGNTPTPQPVAHQVFQLDSALQGEAGFQLAAKACRDGNPYAVAFVDMRMPPGWDGLRTIREIWQVDPDLNIVICTAFSDHSWAEIEAIAGDGDKLLVLKKPFEAIEVRRLAATLSAKWSLNRKALQKMSDLEHLVSQRTSDLQAAATHDKLTGLANRALFNTRLISALELSRNSPDFRFAILFIDIDRFKWVNDSLGHEAGDLLLNNIGDRITRVLRDTDPSTLSRPDDCIIARLGGDEFCILLAGMSGDDVARVLADRILKTLEDPYFILDQQVHVTASIGIAIGSPRYQRAEEIIRDADSAMYRAKADGKGRFVLFDKVMNDEILRRLIIETELRNAVEQGQLRTYFQPIIRLDTGELIAAEALVRWQHPQRGLIPPGEFIGIAEESGIINALGMRVLEESCRQLQSWKTQMPGLPLSVSVNVSPRQLTNRDLLANIESILRATGLDPKSLILEITETALVGNMDLAARVLAQIRDLGVRVYLDDFGTEYSSLKLLHTFRLDGLKIDRSFVMEASGQRHYAAIIQAINDLAHNLGMEVVAEGVETSDQLVLVQALNCEKGQGTLFSPPLAAHEFEAFLRDGGKVLLKARGAAA